MDSNGEKNERKEDRQTEANQEGSEEKQVGKKKKEAFSARTKSTYIGIPRMAARCCSSGTRHLEREKLQRC